ncbi:hypothetical protein [Chitinophaga caseinilytica]|uniref:Uncharacterized protein n=1 Tax=Chitinophaga caseinilytica TaxID=2267521 RepID=A0ABZ2Z825_9BACT
MKKPMLYLALAFAALYGMYSCTKENKVLSDQQLAKSSLSSLADSIPIDTIDTIPTDTIHDSIPLISNRLLVEPGVVDSFLWISVKTQELYNYYNVILGYFNLVNTGALTFGVKQPIGYTPLTTQYVHGQFFIPFNTKANGIYPFRINFKNVNYAGRIRVTDSGYRFNWQHDSSILLYPKFVRKS